MYPVAHGDETVLAAQALEVLARVEVVGDAVHLAGARIAAVVEHQRFQLPGEGGVELGEGLLKRALADAGRSGEDHETGHGDTPCANVSLSIHEAGWDGR